MKSLKHLTNLTLHDRITKSLLHLHKKKKPPSISAQFQVTQQPVWFWIKGRYLLWLPTGALAGTVRSHLHHYLFRTLIQLKMGFVEAGMECSICLNDGNQEKQVMAGVVMSRGVMCQDSTGETWRWAAEQNFICCRRWLGERQSRLCKISGQSSRESRVLRWIDSGLLHVCDFLSTLLVKYMTKHWYM